MAPLIFIRHATGPVSALAGMRTMANTAPSRRAVTVARAGVANMVAAKMNMRGLSTGATESSDSMGFERPRNVGICGIEVYFPKCAVSQADLERFDNVSTGKYTKGLGQQNMGICSDLEDINSIALTALSRLVERTGVSYNDIGRLEVGTETVFDSSKAVKTVLMNLFQESGNYDVEGVDSKNACYGGTQALLNAMAWMESSAWDGRMAAVVCGDIAVYEKGNARPTGGAGAVAMLIGPNAPIVIEGPRASHFENAWDFYKPMTGTEYPIVDGILSNECFTRALDGCYTRLCEKHRGKNSAVTGAGASGEPPLHLGKIDYACFHSPYGKLVRKAFSRLLYNDYLAAPHLPQFSSVPHGMEKATEKEIMSVFTPLSEDQFVSKVEPSMLLSQDVGNMYTASVYACLASLLAKVPGEELEGKRALMYSYGSGLAATMFSLRFRFPEHPVFTNDILERLSSRRWTSPEEFDGIMYQRERALACAPFTPETANQDAGELSDWLFPGTYYLKQVDEKHRRVYARFQ